MPIVPVKMARRKSCQKMHVHLHFGAWCSVSQGGRVPGREVDTMLKVFQDINQSMERTGEFGSAGAAGGSKAELLKMVAKNNVMRTGILSSKIGLTKR